MKVNKLLPVSNTVNLGTASFGSSSYDESESEYVSISFYIGEDNRLHVIERHFNGIKINFTSKDRIMTKRDIKQLLIKMVDDSILDKPNDRAILEELSLER